MPGRLRSSFRSGNLAEHLGLLLLKGVAAVADVARPEDVGLDAIATLLRRDSDGNCYAEDSFVVQLKAESEQVIKYEGHELEWFVNQSQPLFIGRISLADARISLYPTLFVNQAVLALHATNVTIRFGASQLPPFQRGQKQSPWHGEGDNGAIVWLGVPLLQWTLSDLTDYDWAARAYEILKRFIGIARREHELLSFGQSSVLDWSTNDAMSITSRSGMMKGYPNDLTSLAERCSPCLNAIMLQAFSMPAETGNSLMLALVKLAAALRDSGVEVDPEDLFGKFFFSLKNRSNKDAAK